MPTPKKTAKNAGYDRVNQQNLEQPQNLEEMLQNLDRITFDIHIMGGKACIRGMRVPVSLVLNLLANGKTPVEIIDNYPYLEPEDIQQSILYAAWLSEDKVIPLAQAQEKV